MTGALAHYIAMASAWDSLWPDLETGNGFKGKDEFAGKGTVGWIRDGRKGRPATAKKRVKRKKRPNRSKKR